MARASPRKETPGTGRPGTETIPLERDCSRRSPQEVWYSQGFSRRSALRAGPRSATKKPRQRSDRASPFDAQSYARPSRGRELPGSVRNRRGKHTPTEGRVKAASLA